jgi:hypothetical protein
MVNFYFNLLFIYLDDVSQEDTQKGNNNRKPLLIESDITYLRFHRDLRLKEVKKMLSSSQPFNLKVIL